MKIINKKVGVLDEAFYTTCKFASFLRCYFNIFLTKGISVEKWLKI